MVKVLKFGGSCLKSPEDFKKVVSLLMEESEEPVVVVSAVSGVTDLLETCLYMEKFSEHQMRRRIARVEKIHRDLLRPLSKKHMREAIHAIETRVTRLERVLIGLHYTGEVSPSLRAYVLSFGERFSAVVLRAYLKEAGLQAEALESEEAGILAEGPHESATALLEATRERIRKNLMPLVKKGVIPVVTGFYGVNREGKMTLFGRNGSDYSAAVIAYSLDAVAVELWKDVDGFMSADPNIVEKAYNVTKLSYYEAAELSYFGARILHPRTFEPLMGKNIPVYIKNIHRPQEQGTVVMAHPEESERVIKSVAFNRDISIVSVYGPGVGYEPGIIARIGKILWENGININSIITSQTCINLLLERKFADRGYRLLLDAVSPPIEKVRLRKDVSLVAIVGEGLHRGKGLAARAFKAVASAGINIEMLSTGAPERAYYFIVKEDDVERAVRSIHREFFEREAVFS